MEINKTPTGVKIIGILNYAGAAIGIISLIVIGIFGAKYFGGGLALGFAVPVVIGSTLAYFVGHGLYQGKNWARILIGLGAILGFLGCISDILHAEDVILNFIFLAVDGWIAWYLLFNKKVKPFFTKEETANQQVQ